MSGWGSSSENLLHIGMVYGFKGQPVSSIFSLFFLFFLVHRVKCANDTAESKIHMADYINMWWMEPKDNNKKTPIRPSFPPSNDHNGVSQG